MSARQNVQLRISGMTCSGCAHSVEQALRSVAGVAEASVQLMAESASVVLSGEVDRSALVAAVRAAGYDAEVTSGRDPLSVMGADELAHRELLRRHRQALIQAIGLVLPILVIDHFRHVLWSHDDGSQIAARLMELVLLVMLGVSPAGGPILAGGLRALLYRTPNMDLLITMGVVVAFASSVYGTFIARDDAFVHIHAAAMILGLVCVGRYLEARARGRATAALSALAKLAPKTAFVRRGGDLKERSVDEIVVGDLVMVPVHGVIPADGDIVEGEAAIDERLMTGEPMPVTRRAGDRVMGGTTVVDGQIELRVRATGASATIGRIAKLVAAAQSGRTRMQRVADRVAGIFTPIVIAAAAMTFVGWLVMRGWDSSADAARSAIAVLVVACPCALGLATPTVVMVATGAAALRGILVRDAAMLEAMGAVKVVVWDKTGTLTAGQPSVQRIETMTGEDAREVLRLAAAAQLFSPHPLGKAIVEHAKRSGIQIAEPGEYASIPGGGVMARVDGHDVIVGSFRLMADRGVALPDMFKTSSRVVGTTSYVAVDGVVRARIEFADAIRPSSAGAVDRLRRMGVRSEMLTGDAEAPARAVAEQVGIQAYRAAVDPAGKIARIEELKRGGERVAMVGDGINDAAALAAADAGIAFATGAEVAGEAAGIQLIGSTPLLVADAVALARASLRIIRQNLFWAFAYNVLMIPLAAAGALPPALAAGAMMASSLTVVLNALRLQRVNLQREAEIDRGVRRAGMLFQART